MICWEILCVSSWPSWISVVTDDDRTLRKERKQAANGYRVILLYNVVHERVGTRQNDKE